MRCTSVRTGVCGRVFACGKCVACRINKRRIWTHRVLLEASEHVCSSFVTLTYRPEDLPKGATLVPRDLQLFLKRLRQRRDRGRDHFRFFGCGEYGELRGRPHYHAILFGVAGCLFAEERGFVCRDRRRRFCASCSVVREAWGLGHTLNVPFVEECAAYVTGYVANKLSRPGAPGLRGRHSEFGRMSNRPGIGQSAMWNVASDLLAGERAGVRLADVPLSLARGDAAWPLGRYLRGELRRMTGRPDVQPFSYEFDSAVLDLRWSASVDGVSPGVRDRVRELYARRGLRASG